MILNYGDMLGRSLSSGLQQGMQMGQMVDARRQRDQTTEAQNAALAQAGDLYNQGTPEQIAQFAIQNPEAGQMLQQQIGFKNAEPQRNAMASMRDVMTNPANTRQILQNRIAMVEEAGGDATETIQDLQEFRENPESYLESVEKGYAMLDPKGYVAFKQAGPQEQPGLTPMQQATLQGKAMDRQIKMMEMEDKKLDRQLRQETDALKRQEIEQKLATNAEKKQQAMQQKETQALDAYQSGQDTLGLIDEISNHEGFDDLVGAKGASSAFGLFDTPIAGTDAAGLMGKIETLQSKNFMNAITQMKGMGSLSDAEGKKVAAAVSSLSPDMSQKDFRTSLKTIKTITERGMKKQQRILGDKTPKRDTTTMDDDNLINHYLP
jgi:hypothetical protein